MRRTAILSVLLAAGCAVQPRYEKPPVEVPAAWAQSAVRSPDDAPRFAADGRWWRIYQDPALDALVEEALEGNSDLLVAAARIDEARALLGEAQSGFFPRVDGNVGASRQHNSARTAVSPPGVKREYANYRASVNVSYELDLFGRLAANAAAARAELTASEASRDAVRLALAAQVAKSWFALRSLEDQVVLTRETVALREDALRLQRRRHEAGLLSEFELRQLDAEVAAARSALPPLEREREREEAALSVLLGRTPADVFQKGMPAGGPGQALVAPVLPAGLPSELLLRRPDVVEAERRLAALNARVAVARAEVFPSISLTAALGVESAALGSLFSGPAGLWVLGAALAQPIFSGGRSEARTAAAQARERAALAQYIQAVRNAFGEVRVALAAQTRARESFEAESARAGALAETLRLAKLRYDNGIASQLDVIDAERGLLAARIARVEALRAHRAAIADLFRALGA